LIALFFLAPVLLVFLAPHWISGGPLQSWANRFGFFHFRPGASFSFHVQPVGTLLLAGMYLLNMFLATMSSVAFNSEILEALKGQSVSIQHGLEVALSRWKAILYWSLFAGTIGLLIRALEERLSFLGRVVAGAIGLAWSVASIFAIPVLVREASLSNPFTVLSKSAQTIRATWGEMLAGYLGMQGTNLLFLWSSVVYWLGIGATATAVRLLLRYDPQDANLYLQLSAPCQPPAPEGIASAIIRRLPANHLEQSERCVCPPSSKASWEREYRELETEIRLRNYSPKTLAVYRFWIVRFQIFVRSRPASHLSNQEVRGFLSYLAVQRNVSASSQNQAFNSLLSFSATFYTATSAKLMEWSAPNATVTFQRSCPEARLRPGRRGDYD
jgi:hypothetical protein